MTPSEIKSKLNPKYLFIMDMYGVTDKWMTNFWLSGKDDIHLSLLNREKTFTDFLSGSFTWSETDQGHDFWIEVCAQDEQYLLQ